MHDRVTTNHVASHMQFIIYDYGWPDTFVSDNGPCFCLALGKFKLVMDGTMFIILQVLLTTISQMD